MVEVRFNYPREFLRELDADSQLVDRGIVRLTYLRSMMKRIPSHHHVLVVGTALVGEKLLRLETYCGDDFNPEHRFPERAQHVMKKLEEGVRALGLQVRSGEFGEAQVEV